MELIGLGRVDSAACHPSWRVAALRGAASEVHGREDLVHCARRVCFVDVDAPALVLGSSQSRDLAYPGGVAPGGPEGSSVAVVRRASGGGAFLMEPGRVAWIEFSIPRGDPLWDDDVNTAFHWVGGVLAAALRECGVEDVSVSTSPSATSHWSRLACLAGVGPGEVSVEGRKVAGVCQRRTRSGAVFQCGIVLDQQPEAVVAFLAVDTSEKENLIAEIHAVCGSGPAILSEVGIGEAQVRDAVRHSISSLT